MNKETLFECECCGTYIPYPIKIRVYEDMKIYKVCAYCQKVIRARNIEFERNKEE